MFGSYSVCNIIVLLNMLIAMMSNSYQVSRRKGMALDQVLQLPRQLGKVLRSRNPALNLLSCHPRFSDRFPESGSLIPAGWPVFICKVISEKSDTEWKFARTKLWISYFETGSTVPPPFNIFPTHKAICRIIGCTSKPKEDTHKERAVAEKRYRDVMKCIIRRYVTAEQKKTEEFSITEDDVSEIRQDINKFRY